MNTQRQLKSSPHKLAYMKEYQKLNRERINAYNRVYYKKRRQEDPLYSRRQDLRHDFGITIEEYDKMWESQGRRCAICQRTKKPVERAFDVDHDHVTKKVRGILCSDCNKGLGYFKDDTRLMSCAAMYLMANCN
jgi:hypothetical protein